MLGWAKNTNDPIWFAQMTQKLIALDYNVLYLDYDWNRKFGKYHQIDVWWHHLKNNVELTLNLIKFISRSNEWRNAKIRLILINDTSKEGFEQKIGKMLDSYRIEATVKVINNYLAKKSTYDLMKSESNDAALILAGIPEIPNGREKNFVEKTTEMLESIGTTLLVKTSSTLGEDIHEENLVEKQDIDLSISLEKDTLIAIPTFQELDAQEQFSEFTTEIESLTTDLVDNDLASFENVFQSFLQDIKKLALRHLEISSVKLKDTQLHLLRESNDRTDQFREEDIPFIQEKLDSLSKKILAFPKQVIPKLRYRIRINNKRRAYRKPIRIYLENEYLEHTKEIQIKLGKASSILTDILKEGLIDSGKAFSNLGKDNQDNLEELNTSFTETSKKIHLVCQGLNQHVKNSGREMLLDIIRKIIRGRKDKVESKRLNAKQRKEQLKALAEYPQNWLKITDLFCSKMATDIKLHGVQLVIKKIGEQVTEEINTSMTKVTEERINIVENWVLAVANESNFDLNKIPQVDEPLTNDDIRVQELISWAETAGNELPEQLEVMKSERLDTISFHQSDDLEVLPIDSRSSFMHLLSEVLRHPLRKHLSYAYQGNMEILSKLQYDINTISQKVSQQKSTPNPDQVKIMAKNAEDNIISLRERFNLLIIELNQKAEDIINSANSSMNTSTLLDYAVRVIPKVSKNSSAYSFKKWIEISKDWLTDLVDKLIDLLSNSTSSENQSLASKSLNQANTNLHDILRIYTDSLKASKEVYEKIPFYYRQLFVGRQVATFESLKYREQEFERAKAIMKPEHGDGSNLIILGAPLSGKSFFADSLAQEISESEVVKIYPPVSGSTSLIDLKRTLERLSGIDGQGKSVLKSSELGTIFLFEDIELWWNRSETKSMTIRHIVDLVNNVNFKGRIILTCNPFAFKLMERQGLLSDLTLPRITMLPMSKASLKNILLEKHTAGGLILKVNGRTEDEYSNKKLLKILDRCHENSSGLIGVALHQWINSIDNIHDEIISISFPSMPPFPQIEEKEWLILIGQFIIHKHLDANRVQKLFDFRDKKKADRMIRQLVADGVLEDVLGSAYRLNPLVQTAFIKKAESWGLI
jgi:hypothetical protein